MPKGTRYTASPGSPGTEADPVGHIVVVSLVAPYLGFDIIYNGLLLADTQPVPVLFGEPHDAAAIGQIIEELGQKTQLPEILVGALAEAGGIPGRLGGRR